MKTTLTIFFFLLSLSAFALPNLPGPVPTVLPTVLPTINPGVFQKCFAVQTCVGKIDGVYTNNIRALNTYSYRIPVGQPFPTADKIRSNNETRYLKQEKSCNTSRHAQGNYSAYDPNNGNPSWNQDSRAMYFKVNEVCISTLGPKPVKTHNPCEVNADCPSNYRCNGNTGMCYSLVVPSTPNNPSL